MRIGTGVVHACPGDGTPKNSWSGTSEPLLTCR